MNLKRCSCIDRGNLSFRCCSNVWATTSCRFNLTTNYSTEFIFFVRRNCIKIFPTILIQNLILGDIFIIKCKLLFNSNFNIHRIFAVSIILNDFLIVHFDFLLRIFTNDANCFFPSLAERIVGF